MKTYVLARPVIPSGLEYLERIVPNFMHTPMATTTTECGGAMFFPTEAAAASMAKTLVENGVGDGHPFEVYCYVNEVTRVEE